VQQEGGNVLTITLAEYLERRRRGSVEPVSVEVPIPLERDAGLAALFQAACALVLTDQEAARRRQEGKQCVTS
jgi:hypothetical protein